MDLLLESPISSPDFLLSYVIWFSNSACAVKTSSIDSFSSPLARLHFIPRNVDWGLNFRTAAQALASAVVKPLSGSRCEL